MTIADLDRDKEFWNAQTPKGRETLARVCKAREGTRAQTEAAKAAAQTERDDDDPLAPLDAGREAKIAVLEIDNADLAAKMTTSLKTATGRTVDTACSDVVASATAPTEVEIDGAEPEPTLGEGAYIADPAPVVRIRGKISPVGDEMEMELERRDRDDWTYIETGPPSPDGSFSLALRAYRDNSNLYRIKLRGSGASRATAVEIYFDGP